MEVIELQTKIRPDLEETELETGEKLFIDGSSKVVDGKRRSGYAIVNGDMVLIESGPLSAAWSAQARELYALLRALELLKGKSGTLYTDSKYAYGIVHPFGKIWEERGLIGTQGKGLIHQTLVTQILQALRGPREIAVVHVRGHQKGTGFHIRGNNLADREAREAARRKHDVVLTLQETDKGKGTQEKKYTEAEIKIIKTIGAELKEGKWILPDGREILPKEQTRRLLLQLHLQTHWGTKALSDQFLTFYGCVGIYEIAKQTVQGCLTCQKVNKKVIRQAPAGGRRIAYRPFERIQVDFTELRKRRL